MKIQVFMPKTGRHLRYKSQLIMALGVALLASITATDVSAQSASRGNVAQVGQFVSDGQSYQVMQASQVPTAADRPGSIGAAINGQNPVQQVGCQSCGTRCGGACGGYTAYGDTFDGYSGMGYGSCGTCNNAYGSAGYGNAGYGNACGIPCDPYCYASVEGLYILQDENDGFTLSRNFSLGSFDLEPGARITVGSLPNCVNGFEATYVGNLEWNLAGALTGAGNLDGLIVNGFTFLQQAELEARFPSFFNADEQIQTYDAEYWSIEVNRTLVGWDVAKILLGTRYVEYDELYTYSSVNNGIGGRGVVISQTENQLWGFQLGMDLLYPIGIHAYSDTRLRAGGYYNNAQANTSVTDTNEQPLATDFPLNPVFDETGKFAVIVELGTGIRYQLGEMLSARIGTELWYIDGLATAPNQLSGVLTQPRLGVDAGQGVLFVGFSAGAELKY